MKKLTLIIVLALFFQSTVSSQPCLPEGIRFYTQSQIDDFQANYPNCTQIEGDVSIGENTNNITNLNGLSVLTSIGGDLVITVNHNLTSLTGLDNLTSIGGDLFIGTNNALASLIGLEVLTSIGGDLGISNNNSLTSLTGLEGLTSIGGDLRIFNNDSLTNLTGLDNIDSFTDLYVTHNALLSSCEAQWLCNYLSDPNGSINIYKNATGCNNPLEVADSCGITLPCLPFGNYYFFRQADIDSFASNYPNCTVIEGNIEIGSFSWSDITNLNGLNVLTSIAGTLKVRDNDYLSSLTGLDNVTSIGGDLQIGGFWSSTQLTSLSGLDNITSIGGNLLIENSGALTSLTGLDNLTSIGGDLGIGPSLYPTGASRDGRSRTVALTSLTGLESLTTIGGGLRINDIDALLSLTGLENLSSVGGDLSFFYNDSLVTISGLESITSILGDLLIYGNDNLTSLSGLYNVISIEGNLSIGYITGGTRPQIIGNDALENLTGLDNLIAFNGGINIIGNETMTSLKGLESLTFIGGYLNINNNDALVNFSGLDNLTAIGDYLSLYNNDALISLNSLDNVTSIGGSLKIYYNDTLTNILGLNNVTSIGGNLNILGNNALTSLTGLDNINASSINSLRIYVNTSLLSCAAQSICAYLESPNGETEIYGNASGCNSQEEVELACTVSVDEIQLSDNLLIYPSPSSTQISIELPYIPQKNTVLTIYNMNSQLVFSNTITSQKTEVDISGLPKGIYLVKVTGERVLSVGKLVKN